ncbi:MAG: DUF2892 domain-containing protein [Flavobacteriales bacterium]|jgi:hypothetical protein
MKKNIGKLDQTLRFTIGALMILSTLFEWTKGGINILFLVLGSVLLITAGMQFCPLYKGLGVSTCKLKNN